jgi:hypothetical protein
VQSVVKAPESGKTVEVAAQPQEPPAEIRWLSSKTVLLTFRTFAPSAEAPIRDLFKSHQKRLAQTPHWIIDVRQNNGGSDSTYEPIVQVVNGMRWARSFSPLRPTSRPIHASARSMHRMTKSRERAQVAKTQNRRNR